MKIIDTVNLIRNFFINHDNKETQRSVSKVDDYQMKITKITNSYSVQLLKR